MKATRILLFLSPLLYFVPPLISVDDSLGLGLLDYFYRGLIHTFPGNALMAFLCYTYASQLGRDSWPWVVGSLRFPFIAPLILGFISAKYGSAADSQRRAGARPEPVKAAVGPFESRFPLLSAYLAQRPPAADDPRAHFEPIKANFEFSAFADASEIDALLSGASSRQLAVWTIPEDAGVRAFGAGMVDAPAIEGVTSWLRQTAPRKKVATAIHYPQAPTKFFEYYPKSE